MLDILDARPEIVACDLHPDIVTTRMAEARGLPVYRAQHHAAHVAAIAAEHKIDGPLARRRASMAMVMATTAAPGAAN